MVEDYIKSNQIEIVDVSKGGILSSKFDQEKYDDIEWQLNNFFEDGEFEPNEYNRGLSLLNTWRDNPNNSTFKAVVDFWDKQADFMDGQREDLRITNENTSLVSDDTKYSGYQLKGGENYREVLLTMPIAKEKVETIITSEYEIRTSKNDPDRKEVVHNNFVLDEFYPNEGESPKKSYTYYYTDSGKFSQEKGEIEENEEDLTKDNYTSSHWSEKNILAHVRLNEKTLPDGRRVLIVNEIQADISQDLKKEQDKILDRVDKGFDNFLDNLIMNKVVIEEC